jgi:pimeloyl-ACP methyl ester carboxylesterase
MELNYKELGEGSPFIIMHGLYGSSDNWLNIGKELSKKYHVYLLDLRNHGNSPHSPNHNYQLMRDDLFNFMDQHQMKQAIIMGHSMGGKTAIYFSLKYPEKVKKLIVIDISPFSYKMIDQHSPQTISHLNILNALYNLDTKQIKTIKEADEQLAESISFKRVRQFLLKNLKRDDEGKFYWLLNINTLRNDLPRTMEGIDNEEDLQNSEFNKPTLFIKGKNSDYIKESEKSKIQSFFPNLFFESVENAGHWVHAENKKEFMNRIHKFLESNL